jgi:hypothetical protein
LELIEYHIHTLKLNKLAPLCTVCLKCVVFWRHSQRHGETIPCLDATLTFTSNMKHHKIIITVTTFKYVAGGPDREAQEVV